MAKLRTVNGDVEKALLKLSRIGNRSLIFRLAGRAMELRKAENIASAGRATVTHSADRICGEQAHTFSGLPSKIPSPNLRY